MCCLHCLFFLPTHALVFGRSRYSQRIDPVIFSSAKESPTALNSDDLEDDRVPITLLSGFLGAGKTSLLRHTLQNKEGLKVGVIVNDVASVNIDSKLVRNTGSLDEGDGASMDAVELQNGCVCCTMADELFTSVARLATVGQLRNPGNSETTVYDHIVIEASGVAEPRVIRDNFQDGEAGGMPLLGMVRLDTLVTVIDASSFLDAYQSTKMANEWQADADYVEDFAAQRSVVDLLVEQVECADVLVLNKIDLVEPRELIILKEILASLNGAATVLESTYGRAELSSVLGSAGAQGLANFGIVDEHKSAISLVKNKANAPAAGLVEPCTEPACDDPTHDHSHSHSHGAVASEPCTEPACDDPTHDHSHSHSHGAVASEPCTEPACDDPTHDHSHSHSHGAVASSTAESRFGIRSFIYEARRPFSPLRLDAFLKLLPTDANRSERLLSAVAADEYPNSEEDLQHDKDTDMVLRQSLKGLVRSKGFVWLACSSDAALYWSHAGLHFQLEIIGRWWDTVPRNDWPEWQKDVIADDFDGQDGDRRQELVFIGMGLDEQRVKEALDRCLLTDAEIAQYRAITGNAKQQLMSEFTNPIPLKVMQ